MASLSKALFILPLLLICAGVSSACSSGRPTAAKVQAASESPQPAHLGDGVCSVSLTTYRVSLTPPPAGTATLRSAVQAIAISKATNSLLPSTATFSAYSAMLSAPIRLPDPNTALGPSPFANRLVWIVEIGNLNLSDPGGPERSSASPTTTLRLLHHVLDVVDDATGLEPFSLSCQ